MKEKEQILERIKEREFDRLCRVLSEDGRVSYFVDGKYYTAENESELYDMLRLREISEKELKELFVIVISASVLLIVAAVIFAAFLGNIS